MLILRRYYYRIACLERTTPILHSAVIYYLSLSLSLSLSISFSISLSISLCQYVLHYADDTL